MGELAKVIAHDVGMSTKVINVVNSSAYSRGNRKLVLMQALNTLGIDMIKTMVISESVFQTFSHFSNATGTNFHNFWVRSLKTAVLARELAKRMSYSNTEEAYLAGLLHDVGRLALLSVAPNDYASNFMAKDDERLCEIEKNTLGITHSEAGAWLIERWNLDSFLSDSVRYHHEPIFRLKSAHPLIRLVNLSHLLCNYKSDSLSLKGAEAICGVDKADIQTILVGVNSQTKTAASYFGIDLIGMDEELPSAEYEPLEPARDNSNDRLADEVRNVALVSAATQTFSGMRNASKLIEAIARTARILFNFEDTVVLVQDTSAQAFVGLPIGDHQQRLKEFSIPLNVEGILADAIIKRKPTFVGCEDPLLGLVEEQLLRILGTEYLVYLPLIAGKTCLGVLVGGLAAFQVEEMWGSDRFLLSFAKQAATSLESLIQSRNEIEKHIADANEEHKLASRRVVHEVNNPLSIIKNYLGVLDDKLTNNEPVVEELSILNEEIDRVSRIVGGLADPATTRVETTEVNSILHDVVRLFSISRYLPASVNISVKTNDQPLKILGAADPLRQILMNLIKNAVEALPKGGNIEVKNNGRIIREGRPYLELCISDTGTGIPSEVLANLFSPVRSSKKGGNRGLGLNIVQGLVDKLNGLISCDSDERGTTFDILLPVPDESLSTSVKPVSFASAG